MEYMVETKMKLGFVFVNYNNSLLTKSVVKSIYQNVGRDCSRRPLDL